MFITAVPLSITRSAKIFEANIRDLHRLGADRVFLVIGRGFGSDDENQAEIETLTKNIEIYKNAGFETGVWFSTMGHGANLCDADFTRLKGLHGNSCCDSFCPLDPKFTTAVYARVRDAARSGAKIIMIDDDFRLSSRNDCGCTCDRHMAEYRRRLGENISSEEVLVKAFGGGPNRYRDVWYDLMGDTLRDFAHGMRAAVDDVDPTVRLGACTCMSVWDADGVDSIEIARILAGKTKPFMRFSGAPYWVTLWEPPCNHLQYIAELERMQRSWCEKTGIECFAEGDVYPRPRYYAPAAYLETFETILRADGGFDGILKYAFDYACSPFYETGYIDRAERNRSLYDEIDRHFSGKKSVGVGVAHTMKKLRGRTFSNDASEIGTMYDDGFFQAEQLLLTDHSIPITYEDSPVVTIFGENAKYLKSLPAGLILDVPAAEFLEKRGIDTGLASVDRVSASVCKEYFFEENETVALPIYGAEGLMKLELKPGAKALSEFIGAEKSPASFIYENAEGTRFLVLGAAMEKLKKRPHFSRTYCRQSQLLRIIPWLGRAPLPAYCEKNPFLYLLCKRGKSSMAVGMWNLFADEIISPQIFLDKAYKRIEFINCSGALEGNIVRLAADMPPFGIAGFEVFE